jgi:hypothetical protein
MLFARAGRQKVVFLFNTTFITVNVYDNNNNNNNNNNRFPTKNCHTRNITHHKESATS